MPLSNPPTDRVVLTARDVMVKKVLTLSAGQEVFEAIDFLIGHGISGAPVVDDEHRLVGVLSEKDCIRALVNALYENLPGVNVGDAMCTDVTTIREDTDLLTIADLFMQNAFRRLPVLSGDRLVGQISRRDLLRAMSRAMQQAPHHQAAILYLSAVADRSEAPVAGK